VLASVPRDQLLARRAVNQVHRQRAKAPGERNRPGAHVVAANGMGLLPPRAPVTAPRRRHYKRLVDDRQLENGGVHTESRMTVVQRLGQRRNRCHFQAHSVERPLGCHVQRRSPTSAGVEDMRELPFPTASAKDARRPLGSELLRDGQRRTEMGTHGNVQSTHRPKRHRR